MECGFFTKNFKSENAAPRSLCNKGDSILRFAKSFCTCITAALLLTGCLQVHRSSDGSSIDAHKARVFADGLLKDLEKDMPSEVYRKMEATFRLSANEQEFEVTLKNLYATYGKPLESEYIHDTVGVRTYSGGEMKPLRKLFYAVKTTKYPKGVYYLAIEVVPDGSGLASSGIFFGR